MSRSNTRNAISMYGTQGVAAATNVPSARKARSVTISGVPKPSQSSEIGSRWDSRADASLRSVTPITVIDRKLS